ncbi:3-beta hydroxysteroid dehydrogenase/isomerase family-domain-containing protein [Phyllosticta citrichinensis]|uniref:3-beta hydroxysteroid dehydrogenase/isomerase family-domain-containing protein n=1 Tax=Phyllosticta citrichinensis TaxID=1130410 RepID=A0ABR1Y3J8_9PEZI
MSTTLKTLGHVVVVGGCGFLGHHIVNLLVERFPEGRVSVLDLRTSKNRNPSSKVSYHDADITSEESTKSLFEKLKPDVVIHTASPVAHGIPHEIMYKVNVDGTRNLLRASQESGVKAFVYTSSASVIFDNATELVNADESYPVIAGDDQPSYYTSTKVWGEQSVLKANRTELYPRFLTCSIRPAGIFGEGDVQMLPSMLGAYFRKQHKFQLGDNTNLFDFTYAGNVAHAHLLAAAALLQTSALHPTVPLDSERVDGEPFFVTNDQPVPFWDFARAVWRQAGPPLPMDKVWVLPKDVMLPIGSLLESIFWVFGKKPSLSREQVFYSTVRRYYNIDKAKRRLGYRPVVPLGEGIKKGVDEVLDREGPEWAWVKAGAAAPQKSG